MSGIIQMLSTGAAPIPTREYLGVATEGAGVSATFTDVAIGAAAPSRLVVVGLQAPASTSVAVSNVTIGGVSATGIYNVSATSHVSMWTATIPTGTTAEVVVTMTNVAISFGIAVYALYNLESTTRASRVGTSKFISSNQPPTTVDVTLAVPENGILIAINAVNNLQSVSWTGVIEDSDSGGRSSASKQYLSADPTYAISTTLDPGNTATLLAASWR